MNNESYNLLISKVKEGFKIKNNNLLFDIHFIFYFLFFLNQNNFKLKTENILNIKKYHPIQTFNILDLINNKNVFNFQIKLNNTLEDIVSIFAYDTKFYKPYSYHKESIIYHINTIKNNEIIKPVIILKINELIFILDGYHRISAHILEKKYNIPAFIISL